MKLPRDFANIARGLLLEQIIDISGPIGIAYERSCDFYKDFHTHERLMFVCPRGNCAMEIRTKSANKVFLIDSTTILTVPSIVSHDDEAVSAIYDTFALYPMESYIYSQAEKCGLSLNQISSLFTKCLSFHRSIALEQLLQEYFFKRVLQKVRGDLLQDLEVQLVQEVLMLSVGGKAHSSEIIQRAAPATVAQKAMKYIETNLFSDLDLEKICRSIGSSESVLGKQFKAQFKKTPYAYVKDRRLEEAKRLLERGDHSVSEVALLIGYENFGSFSEAFGQKYKQQPRSLQKKDRV